MLEAIILGAVQGVAEWLPVSSEGILVLIQARIFYSKSLEEMLRQAFFLHGGTFLAALIYFRREVGKLIKAVFNYQKTEKEIQKLLQFLLITAFVSGLIGFFLLKLMIYLEKELIFTGKLITLAIGFFLLITGFFQIKAEKKGKRKINDLKTIDGFLLGLAQGLAALPGLSRSGLTVSLLFLRKFDKTQALKLSFLMSLPIVFGGNLFLGLNKGSFSFDYFLGLFFSFLFGLLTIDLLLKLARKINFGYFVILFGLLTIGSLLI